MTIDLDGFLVILSLLLLPFCVLSLVVLVWEARKQPRIGALTERAVIAADIMVMVLSGTVLTINRVTGYSLFPVEVARVLFLASLVLLEFVPVAWTVLLLTGKLGDGIADEVAAADLLRKRGWTLVPPEVEAA